MQKAFRNIWIISLANGFSAFGNNFQFLAITSLTYAMTKSPLITSLQMVVNSIPYIVLAGWAGRVVDKRDPRIAVAIACSLQALLTLMYIVGHSSIVAILGLNVLVSVMGTFARPAQSALVPLLVGKDNLLKGNARKSMIMGIVQLFGPALAGWAIVRIGTTWAFMINAISYLCPVVAMGFVRLVANNEEPDSPGTESATTRISDFLRQRPVLLVMLLGHGGFMLGMWAVNSLYYPYTSDFLGRGPEIMGLFTSAYFGASLLGGLMVERWGSRLQGNKQLMMAYLAGAAVWICYTLIPSVPGVVFLNVLDGTVYSLAITMFQTRVQEVAPRGLLGRIFAAFYAVEETCSIVGMLLGGWVATTLGVIVGFRAATAVSILFILAAFVLNSTKLVSRNIGREPSMGRKAP